MNPHHLVPQALALMLTIPFAAHAQDGIHDLKIGDPAPDFALPGIDGKTHRLAEYKDGKVRVVADVRDDKDKPVSGLTLKS